MSGFGVEPEDMMRASFLDDKLSALLAGQRPAAGDELAAELSLMLEQVQEAFRPAVMPEQVEDAHLIRMMDATAELTASVTAPMAAAEAPAAITAPLAPTEARFLDKMRAGLSHRVAAATLALTTAFGGAAYAGILPTRIQSAVSNAAAIVGLQLPRPDDGGADEASGGADGERDDHEFRDVTDGLPDDDYRRGGDAAGFGVTEYGDTGTGAGTEDDRDDDGRVERDDEDDDERDDDEDHDASDEDDADDYDDPDESSEGSDDDSEESDDEASDVEDDSDERPYDVDEPDDDADSPGDDSEDDVEGSSRGDTDSERDTSDSEG